MKNYKEMTRCILDARDDYDKKKHRQQMIIKRCTVLLSSACCAVLLCFGILGVWDKVNVQPEIDVMPSYTEPVSEKAVLNTSAATELSRTTSVNTKTSTVKASTIPKDDEAETERLLDEYDDSSQPTEAGYSVTESSPEETKASSAITASKPIKTTTVIQTKPKTTTEATTVVTEETELPTDVTEIKGHKVFARFCDIVDSMDNDNYTSKLTELYKDLYEILDSDYMSDEGRTDALTRLHNKEYDMDCLFPRVTDIISGSCSPDAERMTLSIVNDMIENTDSFNQIYWGFMSYEPDVIEDFGLSGKREYWLDNYGAEKILFYPSSGNVVYDSYGDETKIYPKR